MTYEDPLLTHRSLSKLSPDIRRILQKLAQEALVSQADLAHQMNVYSEGLDNRAQRAEFFDLETAKRSATLCRKLLKALPPEPSTEQHRLTQLAISYFVLEHDAEDDNESLIGFDDDLQVAMAVIEALNLQHLLEDVSTNG